MKTFSSVFHIILNFEFMMAGGGGEGVGGGGGGGVLSKNVGHHG